MQELKRAARMLLALTALTGVIYPLAVTAVAQVVMPSAANGSLITADGEVVGSSLIGQGFADPKHFWSRASATSPTGYNGAASSGSNQGPLNDALADAVKSRVAALVDADPQRRTPVPVDLVTASASGLDPHVSVAGARYQVARVAAARGLAPDAVQKLVDEHTAGRDLSVLGEPRVNVLELNLALDAMHR
ncbi:potassium-transporting ATPase subunit KdpC [Candidatus Binatia bacterium]|nr:potassium-transporting ATPase subunit KdpC [Candidatus Binatia bacterium]